MSRTVSTKTDVLAERVKNLVREDVRAMSAYHVADAGGMVKLDAMENPYGWPTELQQQWLQELQTVSLNRYPDPQADNVKSGLRRAMGIDEKHSILLGNGSDEIIQHLALAMAGPGRSVLAPEPSFVMYRVIAQFVQMNYIGVPLQADFDLDQDNMLAEIKQHQPHLIFLALSNNPTGNLFSEKKVRAVIEAAQGLVVLDEAYTAFTDADHLSLLDEYDNVVVMRTVSKIGLAGLRLGMLVGHPLWLTEIDKVRLPYNINVLTQYSAEFALRHYDLLMDQAAILCSERERLLKTLSTVAGIDVWPSEANFLLLRCQKKSARDVFEALKQRGVLVKLLDGAHPLLAQCLRVTVSTSDENNQFLEALSASLS